MRFVCVTRSSATQVRCWESPFPQHFWILYDPPGGGGGSHPDVEISPSREGKQLALDSYWEHKSVVTPAAGIQLVEKEQSPSRCLKISEHK